MIVNSGKWPCVCWKGVQANSVQCTVCNKLIHKWCSGVRGDLSRVADGFRCRRCDGTIQKVDLAEDLMVDGETYECVKSFCYLADTLDGDGRADLVRFAIGLYFLLITFFLHFFLSWISSLSISSSAMSASTLSTHVLFSLPTGLLPSTLYLIDFFT